ncbi:MAG: hypothetical protein SFW67_25945 [Myxococcaceae bacterium]|nr:hypothetical protein [Myxococcaceae bacterium]
MTRPYYEVFVDDADGHQWNNSAILKYLPKGQGDTLDGGDVVFLNTRKQALAARKRILKNHPTALVRIFEVDPKLDEDDPRSESEFDLDRDGVFVPRDEPRRHQELKRIADLAARETSLPFLLRALGYVRPARKKSPKNRRRMTRGTT